MTTHPITDIRHPSRREERRQAAREGWRNWHLDRGRVDLAHPERWQRQVSWRRAH